MRRLAERTKDKAWSRMFIGISARKIRQDRVSSSGLGSLNTLGGLWAQGWFLVAQYMAQGQFSTAGNTSLVCERDKGEMVGSVDWD